MITCSSLLGCGKKIGRGNYKKDLSRFDVKNDVAVIGDQVVNSTIDACDSGNSGRIRVISGDAKSTFLINSTSWELNNAGFLLQNPTSLLWDVKFDKTTLTNPTTKYVVAAALLLDTGRYQIGSVTVNFQTLKDGKWRTLYSNSSPTDVVVTDENNSDIFSSCHQYTDFIQLQTVFNPPPDFNEEVNVNIIIELSTCGGKLSFNKKLPAIEGEDRFKDVKLLVESNDVFSNIGTYTNFNTDIGRTSELGLLGNEFVRESGKRFVRVTPFPITYDNDRTYFCKSTLWKEDKVLVIELEGQRYQFLCDRGLTIFSTDKVLIPGTNTPVSSIKVYSAEQWASGEVITNLWNTVYQGKGFKLVSTNGDTTLNITNINSLIAILDQMSTEFGVLESGNFINPLSTSAGGALSSVIWLKLSIDSNNIGSLLFNAKVSLLFQQQTDVAAVNQSYERLDGKTYNQVLQLLFDVISNNPGTELKSLYNSVQMIVYSIVNSMYLVKK